MKDIKDLFRTIYIILSIPFLYVSYGFYKRGELALAILFLIIALGILLIAYKLYKDKKSNNNRT